MSSRTDPTLAALAAFIGGAIGLGTEWIMQYHWILDVNRALGLTGTSTGDLSAMISPMIAEATLGAGVALLVYLASCSPGLARVRHGALLPLAVVVVWLGVCAVGHSVGWAQTPWPGWFEAADSDFATAAYGWWEMASMLLAAVAATLLAVLGARASGRTRGTSRPARQASAARQTSTAGKAAAVRSTRTPSAARTVSTGATSGRRTSVLAILAALAVAALVGAWFAGIPIPYLTLSVLACACAWALAPATRAVWIAFTAGNVLLQAGHTINAVDARATLLACTLAIVAPLATLAALDGGGRSTPATSRPHAMGDSSRGSRVTARQNRTKRARS